MNANVTITVLKTLRLQGIAFLVTLLTGYVLRWGWVVNLWWGDPFAASYVFNTLTTLMIFLPLMVPASLVTLTQPELVGPCRQTLLHGVLYSLVGIVWPCLPDLHGVWAPFSPGLDWFLLGMLRGGQIALALILVVVLRRCQRSQSRSSKTMFVDIASWIRW